MEIVNTIEKYIAGIITDQFHRYKSWDNCFQAFSVSNQAEIQVLQLAFYLASWGMYRGSSGLLQKNHLIHTGAVDIIFSKNSQQLKCNSVTEIKREKIEDIIALKEALGEHYGQDIFEFKRGDEEIKTISATDTLLSKVILGTLGCVPAYDRYFKDGLKEKQMEHRSFNKASLNELFDFIDRNKNEIESAQKLIKIKTQIHYPIMKILDMYFWQIGYDKEVNKLKQQKE